MRHAAFADFYRLMKREDGSTYYQPACGDRSVYILDGRQSRANHHAQAKEWARKHKYDGYRLARGTFSAPFYLTAAVQPVKEE